MKKPPVLVLVACAAGLLVWPAGIAARTSSQAITAPQAVRAPAVPELSRDEMEAFLRRAKVVKTRAAKKGITGTLHATLSDGAVTHDASIQTIDERRSQFQTAEGTEIDFRDTWAFNVAAYELDKLLGIGMIPATVARRYHAKDASYTWWVDDVVLDEGERIKQKVQPPNPSAWNNQMWIVRVFDQLIYNTDRNAGNLLITSAWRIWMIDHSRAFRRHEKLKSPANLVRCDRRLLDNLRRLDKDTLGKALRDHLGPLEIEGLLARRDAIVAHFDKLGPRALYDAGPLPH